MLSTIKTIADVVEFARQLISEGTSFHPDDDFTNIVSIETGEAYYSLEAASLRNKLMDECYAICQNENKDIYSLMLEVTLKETGMDQNIPLPSQAQAEA